MLKLRIVFLEELLALARLFYLTEGRNLEQLDYQIANGYIYIHANISTELNDILKHYEDETIWAPLWVEGLARGFFSNDSDTAVRLAGLSNSIQIPWISSYGPIVFVDRNYYQEAADLAKRYVQNWIYTGEMDYRRLITGGILRSQPLTIATAESSEAAELRRIPQIDNFYKLPLELVSILGNQAVTILECYLYGWSFFILPITITPQQLIKYIAENYRSTRYKRVVGGRKIDRFSDLGYAVTLDSGDEVISLLQKMNLSLVPIENPQFIISNDPLTFPPNPNLEGDDARIWEYPVKVGDEDLPFELSYYRETNSVDEDYWKYRETKIRNLNPAARDFFIGKYLNI